jgi:DNA (cytosine-5)-methyltransferase 1
MIERTGAIDATKPWNVATNLRVRRLTPLECERLQGFPDGYTNVAKLSDSARYKALGNSWAVPCARWIGERIAAVDTIPTQATKEAA